MDVKIILPKRASESIEMNLVYLTEVLVTNKLGESYDGFLGGQFGYGTDFENAIDQWGEEQLKHFSLSPENQAAIIAEDIEARTASGELLENLAQPAQNKTNKKFSFPWGKK